MRCPRCKFENIPGQTSCIRCGSVLEIKPSAIDVHPPRMAGWKKPFRSFTRWIRKQSNMPDFDFHFPPWFKDIFSDSFLGLFLSIIPGLAHLVQSRFKEVRLYVLIWAILLLSGLFFYGSTIGFTMLGLAIGLHAGIALQYGIIKDLSKISEKIVIIILVLAGLTALYVFSPRIIVPNLIGGYSNLAVPYYNVEIGDYLLAWRTHNKNVPLLRGSLVSLHPPVLGGYRVRGGRSEETVIGEVVGLPGELLEITDGAFFVDGQQLNQQQYPVPEWLKKITYSDTIPTGSYFVSMRYNVSAHGVTLLTSNVSDVSIIKAGDIEAKFFMKWWPINRRGIIKVN